MNANERRARELRSWLALNGITQTEVAERAGVSRPLVTNTIAGNERNRRVYAALLDLGCPERLLSLTDQAMSEVRAIREAA